ncbi:MAG TPA: hypothetical protein ENI85_03260 [Deltaproteobacteria bacterium]|nr:hypothetical protein [Deltaproteobacteria bacterium]
MSDISIVRNHQLDKEEIRARIGKLADKISDRLGGSWCWEGDEAVCESRGARARVGYDERSISIEIALPRTLRPFRRKLESKVEAYLVGFLGEG